MRQSRIKPKNGDYYVHICNRIAGMPGEYPFGDVEKEMFVRLMEDLARLFTLEIIGYQVMGNHYHIVAYIPENQLSDAEAELRYNAYYEGKKEPIGMDFNPQRVREVAEWMSNPSAFAAMLQMRFTTWFNRTRFKKRRGGLWADRFKSTILEQGDAMLSAFCYVELNAVRADLVDDPADYRFGSWGRWQGSGKHPFAEHLEKHLNTILPAELREGWTLKDWQRFLRCELARRQAAGEDLLPDDIHEAPEAAAPEPGLLTTCHRRIRYWADGGIVGSKTFVMNVAAQFRSAESLAKRRLKRLIPPGSAGIYAFKILNLKLE